MAISPWYDSTRDAAAIPAKVAQRAVEWLVELQDSSATPERIDAWRRWRTEHPDHERAWQRIEAVSGKLGSLSSPARSMLAYATLAPPRSAGRRRAIKTLSLLIFSGGLAWAADQNLPWREWSADYRTDVGERRTVVLSDGTQVALNTGSAIDIRFDSLRRRIRLVGGEILVTTAKDPVSPARPFSVETPHGIATALGTRFTVRMERAFTQVGVFQGAVQLLPASSHNGAVVLHAGQQGKFSALEVLQVDTLDRDSAAWSDGFIVARAMRVADLIEQLGRYTDASLSCDPAVADTRVSGSYPLDDIGAVLDTLGMALGLAVERRHRFWGGDAIRLVPLAPGSRRA